MAEAYVRARRLLAVAALIFVVPALSRPILVSPQRLHLPQLVPPTSPGEFATIYGRPVIDGDTLIVDASRAIDTNGGVRPGVFLFERNAQGTWNYAGALLENGGGEIMLNGNLATVLTTAGLLIFERGAAGWVLADTLEVDAGEWNDLHRVYRIDDGSFIAGRYDTWNPAAGCLPPFQQYRKVSGVWTIVATIGGERCTEAAFDANDGRALIVPGAVFPAGAQPPADIRADTGTATWPLVGHLSPPPVNPRTGAYTFGRNASLSGNAAYVDYGWLYRNNGGNNWVATGKLHEPESELEIGSYQGKLRGDTLVVYGNEYDYELRDRDPELSYDFHTLRAYRKLANGYFDYYAKLPGDYDIWWWSLSEDGRRVAAVGNDDLNGMSPGTRLYVYEIPDTATFNGTQQDTFETGNLARWTTSGSPFTVATNGATRVMRQSGLADNFAYLTNINWADQAIEADLRLYDFANPASRVSLVTRRNEEPYTESYFASLSPPNVITIHRRDFDGVDTQLARATLRTPFVSGRSYRVRFEAVASQLAVFVDGIPRLRVQDSTIERGQTGFYGHATRYDVDNVVVSSGTRVLARLDTWERFWSGEYIYLTSGRWRFAPQSGGDVNGDGENDIYALQQTDSSGDVKWFSKVALGNQVISTRVRPVRYGATTPTQDAWVGLAAQVKDENNYYYVTLRDSNQLSLRRMVDGQVQVLATVPQTVTRGAWHDLRLEIINTSIRVHVNGTLKIQMNDPTLSGGGRSALLSYKTAADWLSYVAYQP